MAGVIPKHELKVAAAAVKPVVVAPEKVVEKVEEKPALPPRKSKHEKLTN